MTAILTAPVRAVRGFRAFRRTILWWLLWRRQKWWLVTNILLSFVATGLSILAAQVTASIFDQGIGDRSEPLMPLVVRLVVIAAAEVVVLFANLQVGARIEYQIEYDLRNRLYDHLHEVDPGQLDSIPTGQVVTRSLSDLELLQLLLQIIPLLVSGVPILIGYSIYLSFVNVPLTLLTASLFAVNGYLVNRIRPRLWGLAVLGLNQQAEVTTAIDEPVRGIRVVKAFVGEDRERSRVKEAAAKAYEFVLTRARLEARFDLLLRAAPVLVRASLLLFGARLVVSGGITLGQFVIFYSFLTEGTYIAQWLDELVALWQVAKSGAGRITQLLAVAPAHAVKGSVDVPDDASGLELRRVGVAFGDHTVLADLDLVVSPGSLTVLSGGPGSGKSTVAGLAAAMVPPTEGTVRLDGVDVDALDPTQLHRAVHLVTEEPFLFARSVRENLAVGALAGTLDTAATVDDDRLWAALEAAGATDVVRDLPNGLDEVLGDRGMTLSGGQRQRLALARALVVPPRVLVLDDALSAVNPALEVEILRTIRRHAPGTGILCITRRPGPRSLADAVVELPPPGTCRAVETVVDLADPTVTERLDAMRRVADSPAYDPRLLKIFEGIELSGDRPELPEAAATDHQRPPGLMRLLLAQRRRLAQAAGALLLVTAVGLVPEFVFGEAADYVREGNTTATDRLAAGLVLVAVLTGVGQYTFRITAAKVNQGVLYGLRRRIFERLSRLGIEYFDRELPGYVSARVVHDIDVVAGFLGGGFGDPGLYRLVSNTALVLGALGIIAFISPQVALVVLPFLVVVVLITMGQIRIADRAYARARARLGDVVARLQEDLAGRYVLRAFGAEDRARAEFGAATLALRRARRWATTVSNAYIGVIQLALAVGAATIYARAGTLSLEGALSVGAVLTLRLYLDHALRPIRQLGRLWQQYVRARVSFRQLSVPFGVPLLPVAAPEPRRCPPLDGEIAFEGVTFAYPGTSRQVLHGVDLTVAPGTTLAVVGYTGAGKSSIAKLLGRIYDPDAGRVLVDGIDVRTLDLGSFRRRLGIVPQDAFVFRGTVASNIAYGRPDATPGEIEDAARAVGALDTLLARPGGLSATVEEEGRNLTAAERQLIALARMWLVQPDVLVLDEATASLDAEAEARVLDAVAALGRTTILVTHRLPVAERADEAVVVADGRVVERGSHDELLDGDGAYASLWTFTGQVDGESAGNGSRRKDNGSRARASGNGARRKAAVPS